MMWMLVRLVLSLGLVAGLLVLASRVAKKRGLGTSNELIEVVARQRLGRASSVTVLKVAGRVLVVGTTDAQVTLLTEVDGEEFDDAVAPVLDELVSFDDQPDDDSGYADLADDEAPAEHQARVTPTRLPAQRRPASSGALAGSVLDRGSWTTVVQELRERTVRH